ncbi:LysR family transcriptional regulator ArgP [Kiloniella sp. b19]|uniref:LysR family transcriptional regulator ArgP n=1 Tax=Kiloniella sp. GXU_MW_B19 TaxID=3141326 RepID=UPI0031DA4EEC
MLDYRKLEALVAVIEEGSFEAAASRLCVTQSAVSQRIRQLEEQERQLLVIREQPCRPTGRGQVLFRHALQVRHLEQALESDDAGAGLSEWMTIPLAVNADSLAFWFLKGLAPFLQDNRILLDLKVADQDRTEELMTSGHVLACLSSRSRSIQGCDMVPLGRMVYRCVMSSAFSNRYGFGKGEPGEFLKEAPAVIYNRDDDLHRKAMKQAGLEAFFASVPKHWVPDSIQFGEMVRRGLAYGMVPDLQRHSWPEGAEAFVEIAPDTAVEVELYWHVWSLASPKLKRLTQEVRRFTGELLEP